MHFKVVMNPDKLAFSEINLAPANIFLNKIRAGVYKVPSVRLMLLWARRPRAYTPGEDALNL